MNDINPYFIEVRIVGRPKYDILNAISVLSRQFQLKSTKIVPHIRLVGPFNTNDEDRLIKDFETVCSQTEILNYKIAGVNVFHTTGVLYLNVESDNKDLEDFRLNFRSRLQSYCKMSYWDFAPNYKFHVTLASKIPDTTIDSICDYMSRCKPLEYDCVVLRATLLKNGKIICEYDFVECCNVDLREHSCSSINRKSIAKFYESINAANNIRPQIYFTSDPHFSDINVIDNCRRPFIDVETMNSNLACNWNSMVTPRDTVYMLGDFTYHGCNIEEFDYWANRLNGRLIFIEGNHDQDINSNFISFQHHAELEVDDHKFYMIHDPKRVPAHVLNDENNWIIHGHTHNRRLDTHPFINFNNRHINISTDLTNFRPISLIEIMHLINNKEKYKSKVNVRPELKTQGLV